MKLSVIIPIYNVEKYVAKCILSVVNNDLQARDFEIIVVDDASPDTSLQIATALAKNNSNIKIISQENKGLGGARNTGIKNAKGDYLLFLDSDDWYLPNVLKGIIDKAIANDLDILEFGAQGIDENGKVVYTKSLTSQSKILNGIEYCAKYHYMDSACNKLYKRSFLQTEKLLFLERLYIEDYEFNTRVFLKVKKVMAVDTIVAYFLQSPNSITRNVNEAKRLKMQNDIINVIKRISILKSENNNCSKYFEQRLSFLIVTLFYQLIKDKASFNEFVQLKEKLKKDGVFCVNYTIFDTKKNLFRIILLKNFFIFKILTKIR